MDRSEHPAGNAEGRDIRQGRPLNFKPQAPSRRLRQGYGGPSQAPSRKPQAPSPDVKLGKFINLYGCDVGDETKIGAFVEIQKNARVGRRCKISSHTFICEGVTVEDHVFIGHGVMFINDSYPRATTAGGELQTAADWKVERTVVKKGASIGSGATVLCNVTIGERAIVGAGSVVTRDVPPDTIVVGNPARVLRAIGVATGGSHEER